MNQDMTLLKAQCFDMVAAESQKAAAATNLLIQIAQMLGVNDLNAILPELQKRLEKEQAD